MPTIRSTASRPNIVLILTDDLDAAAMSQLPGLKASMTDEGTSFSNAFVSLSLCCPSRSTILTGEYAHDTGIYGNQGVNGGYQAFHDRGNEDATLGVWLQGAGYRTALMGKYLNQYPGKEGETYIPPGWSEWDVPAAGNPYSEYSYSLNKNGTLVAYDRAPDDYLTTVLDRKATDFIGSSAQGGEPFFLYLATYAPHQPATPPPEYKGHLADVDAPRPESFNEEDVSDKPSWLADHPLLTDEQQQTIDTMYRRRVTSMYGVEQLVDDVIAKLKETGQLENTYIIFTSDNGFHLGEHRLTPGKNTEFDTDLRVPLIIRGPDIAAGHSIDALVGNVDLAPTIAAMAGVDAPESVEGRSLLPLLLGESPTWREAYLLEHGGPEALDESGSEDGSGLAEPQDTAPGKNTANGVPVFVGLRTPMYTYVRYENGEEELYDDVQDPDQLTNIASSADDSLLAHFSAWVTELTGCHGADCRAIEEQEPGS